LIGIERHFQHNYYGNTTDIITLVNKSACSHPVDNMTTTLISIQ